MHSTGTLLSVPFPRSELYRAKGNRMRTIVQPPPSTRCDLCGGELRLKLVESASLWVPVFFGGVRW